MRAAVLVTRAAGSVKRDVKHVLFRCPLTNAACRDELPTVRERKNNSLVESVRKWQLKFLAFLTREKHFKATSTDAHEIRGARAQ